MTDDHLQRTDARIQMIVLNNVSWKLTTPHRETVVLSRVSLVIPSNRKIALIGSVPEHNRAFLELVSGVRLPNQGVVSRKARVSFPAGYQGGFSPEASVRKNVAHVARMYRADIGVSTRFVEENSGLGRAFDRPLGELAVAQRTRLSHLLAYTLPFELYLDSTRLVHQRRHQQNVVLPIFESRARSAGIIITAGDLDFATTYCDIGLVLESGSAWLVGPDEFGKYLSRGARHRRRL